MCQQCEILQEQLDRVNYEKEEWAGVALENAALVEKMSKEGSYEVN